MPRNEYTCDCRAVNHQLVAETAARMPEEETFRRLSAFYKILSDPTRCKLIFALQQHEMCVCDLSNVLSMTKSSVSHQLGLMRACGAVKCRREGKTVWYSLDDEHVSQLFAVTLAHVGHKMEQECERV